MYSEFYREAIGARNCVYCGLCVTRAAVLDRRALVTITSFIFQGSQSLFNLNLRNVGRANDGINILIPGVDEVTCTLKIKRRVAYARGVAVRELINFSAIVSSWIDQLPAHVFDATSSYQRMQRSIISKVHQRRVLWQQFPQFKHRMSRIFCGESWNNVINGRWIVSRANFARYNF